jgi:hypothetical protein
VPPLWQTVNFSRGYTDWRALTTIPWHDLADRGEVCNDGRFGDQVVQELGKSRAFLSTTVHRMLGGLVQYLLAHELVRVLKGKD